MAALDRDNNSADEFVSVQEDISTIGPMAEIPQVLNAPA
jgi:hypothetical protein